MRTLEELSDREDIRDLRLDYAHHFDGGNLEALLGLYVDDAVCDFGGFGYWNGKEEMRHGWAPYFTGTAVSEPFPRGRHVVTNPQISIDGDEAQGTWHLTDITYTDRVSGRVLEHPVVLYGTYEDHYRRVDGTWRIISTTLHIHWRSIPEAPTRTGGEPAVESPPAHAASHNPRD